MTYQIQVVTSPFSGPIPERLWETVSSCTGEFSALREAISKSDWYAPSGSGSWSGHVRIMDENGTIYTRNVDRCYNPSTVTPHAWCGWCLGTDQSYLRAVDVIDIY